MSSVELSCGRRAIRRIVDLSCAVTPKQGRTRRLRLTELSPLGGWVRTSNPLPVGSLIRLRVTLPDGDVVDLRAEIMWTETRRSGRGAGMGVELVAVAEEDADRIARAIEGCPPVDGEPTRFSFADRVA